MATFYAFQDFWPGRQLYHTRKAKKKRKEKPAKGEKLPLKNPSVIKRIVSRPMNGRTFSCKEENVLHQILAISGDSSPYESGGSPYGKKLCQCKEKCDCKRRFSDPKADWGWGSSHNVWFYGYTGYDTTAAGSKHDLPIYIGMGQASRHDSVMGLRCLDDCRRLYPDITVTRFLGDSAHNAYPYYELLKFWQIEPFIDLNKGRCSGDGPNMTLRIIISPFLKLFNIKAFRLLNVVLTA
jgi:hypothetical protein